MTSCRLCELPILESIEICNNCGWNHEREEIGDQDQLHAFQAKLKKSKKWVEEVQLKKCLTKLLIKKYGTSSTNPEYDGWSITKTAKLLGEARSLSTTDINLAQELDKHPELLKFRNKTEAKKRLKQIKNGFPFNGDQSTFEFEEELQTYLYNNWEKTPFYNEWELHAIRYNTGEIGEIDLLARHRKEQKWLVIELKRNQSSDETVGQTLRYMGWVKENLMGEVEGQIISETIDEHLRYALLCVSKVTSKVYRLINGLLDFKDSQIARIEDLKRQLSQDELKKLFEKLQNQK